MKAKKEKAHIRQPAFADRNISALEHHARDKKKLLTPFSKVSTGFTFLSWKDECIPNILWACILAAHLGRRHYLDLFRRVAKNMREMFGELRDKGLTHNYLATLTKQEFSRAFAPVLNDPDASRLLSALVILESPPDIGLWKAHLSAPVDKAIAGGILAKAVIECLDHQSIPATDIRWIKLVYQAITGRMHFTTKMEERIEELRFYPDRGDQSAVGASIRAMEIATRRSEHGEAKPSTVPASRHQEFWAECYQKTECIIDQRFDPPAMDTEKLLDDLTEVANGVSLHFDESHTDAGFDSRRDAAFGLVNYAIALTFDVARAQSHIMATGRILLRTVVELFVTLRYLTFKDDPDTWAQYRSYGSGQAKLAFLKGIREDEVPSFINLAELELLANEDKWLEFQDIDLGSWAGSDLRKMSIEAGCKDVYDKYYSWASGYSHGHWVAVRDSVFKMCLNPLHRLHRVPTAPRAMPSVLKDCCTMVNRMLDDLSALYPSYEARLEWHNDTKAEAELLKDAVQPVRKVEKGPKKRQTTCKSKTIASKSSVGRKRTRTPTTTK